MRTTDKIFHKQNNKKMEKTKSFTKTEKHGTWKKELILSKFGLKIKIIIIQTQNRQHTIFTFQRKHG